MIDDKLMDDLLNVRWPVGEDRRGALSDMIEDCFKCLLSCTRLNDHLLRQDDEQLTGKIVVTARFAKNCRDMLETLLNWATCYPEEMRAAVEDFVRKCEFAVRELRKHMLEWTPEAHAEGLSPTTEGTIRKEHEHFVTCLTSCVEFARVWFDLLL